jgi:hypothetical protein
VSVPPALQVLEQKMAQIRFSTARVSARFGLGELGPAGAELGTGVKGTNGGFVTSTVGVIRLSPRRSISCGRRRMARPRNNIASLIDSAKKTIV